MEEGIVIRKHQDAAVPQQSIGHPHSQKGQSDQKAYSDTPPETQSLPLQAPAGCGKAEDAVRYRQRQKHQGHHQKQFQHTTSLIGYAILSGAGSQRHAFSGVSRLPSIIPAQQTGGATTPFKYFAEDKTLAGQVRLLHKKTGHPKLGVLFHSGAGNEARARFPASREWLTAIRRPPASPLIQSRLRRGAEAASSLSDEKTGHPKLGVLFHSGAGNEARTRYLHLGKVALYQMSYARGTRGFLN